MQHFPEVGALTLGGGGVNTQFCLILPKMHEIERIWTTGGGVGGGGGCGLRQHASLP